MLITVKYRIEKISDCIIQVLGKEVYIMDGLLVCNGRTVICSGMDEDPEIAEAKMASEVAERIEYLKRYSGVLKMGANSSGFAAHSSVESAKEYARFELMERWWNTHFRFNPELLGDYVLLDDGLKVWVYDCPDTGLFYRLSHYRLQCKEYGWGAAAHSCPLKAREKSVMEAAMVAHSLKDYGRRGNAVSSLASYSGLASFPDQISYTESDLFNILGRQVYVVQAKGGA